MSDLIQKIQRAISDPGAILPRGDNYREPITAWAARAVVKVLNDEKGVSCPICHLESYEH